MSLEDFESIAKMITAALIIGGAFWYLIFADSKPEQTQEEVEVE